MSRIGIAPIQLPDGVEVKIDGQSVTVKGKLGELHREVSPSIAVKEEEGQITLERKNEEQQTRADHGLNRMLLANMVTGVSEGFTKKLELVGVGFRAQNQGQKLDLALGHSHNIVFQIPEQIKVETQTEKGQPPLITLTSHDNELLGMVAAKIRSFRKPEPYKGKGVRYQGEQVRSKAGKTASK